MRVLPLTPHGSSTLESWWGVVVNLGEFQIPKILYCMHSLVFLSSFLLPVHQMMPPPVERTLKIPRRIKARDPTTGHLVQRQISSGEDECSIHRSHPTLSLATFFFTVICTCCSVEWVCWYSCRCLLRGYTACSSGDGLSFSLSLSGFPVQPLGKMC